VVSVDPALYPFAPHYLARPGGRMHYVDEGAGAPLLMLHGNPTWSFYYRDMILALRTSHRCIAPDYLGCGYSDKPRDVPYSLQSRVADVTALVDALDLTDLTLVVHDWGGAIGFAWAVEHVARVRRLVVMNTAAFRMPAAKHLPRTLSFVRNTTGGAWLVQGCNLFARAALVMATRSRLPRTVREGYLAPYDSWHNRRATLRFVQDIPLVSSDPAYAALLATEQSLHKLRCHPMLICWGEHDFVFDHHFLREWQARFPEASVHRYKDAGHYVLEDAGPEVIAAVREFVA
jgi:haloalkane dehalogenase